MKCLSIILLFVTISFTIVVKYNFILLVDVLNRIEGNILLIVIFNVFLLLIEYLFLFSFLLFKLHAIEINSKYLPFIVTNKCIYNSCFSKLKFVQFIFSNFIKHFRVL